MAKTSHRTLNLISVEQLRGVAKRVADRLAGLGIFTVEDLLFHLPLRYQDRTRLVPIAQLQPGSEALVEGTITATELVRNPRRALRVWLVDGDSALLVRFFHFSPQQAKALTPGLRVRCYGEVRQGFQAVEMVHPEYRIVSAGAADPRAGTLTPVYPTTDGMHQTTWRNLIGQGLDWLERDRSALSELLPPAVVSRQVLPSLAESLLLLHRPPREIDQNDLLLRRHPAFQRLALEELTAQQLSLRRLRSRQRESCAPALTVHGRLRARFLDRLSFPLTAAQRRVVAEIDADLKRSRPMQRLLQGDVGSGKTVVAALAALQVIESGYQVALMAPTELLSEQHQRNLTAWLGPHGIAPLWLAGRHKGRGRAAAIEQIATGDARVVVGTHALFQAGVRFARLGLIIIDEQHRFGVEQRMSLLEKGRLGEHVPHQLIMTATPIPRSLAMTLYADLDLSVIDQLPPGRKPVTTVAVPDDRRDEVIDRVRAFCAEGHQAYWVCTLVEESETLQCQAAEETARLLSARLPDLRVGLVHGRLKGHVRDEVMGRFVGGELDLLVATTVVEVGVDVPTANLMVIENPERLGLAQLHQLRGRIGRGDGAGHCVLLYHRPLSDLARTRLGLLRETNDGFIIARKDLELRGPGEVLGTRQTGAIQFRIADPLRDQALLTSAQQIADSILEHQPALVDPLISRWLRERDAYGRV